MSFDFHGLCHLDAEDFDDELERVNQYTADILALFHQSAIGKKFGDLEEGSWIDPFLHYALFNDLARLPHMRARDVRYLMEEIFPAKVTVKQEQAQEIIPEMIAFWQFVDGEFDQPNAKAILKYLQKVEKKYPKIIMDERKFGVGKTVVMEMFSQDVDLTDKKAVAAFIAEYNQQISSDDESSPKKQSGNTLLEKQTAYPSPVNELLTLGKPEASKDWPDYLDLGFSQDHLAGLLQMVVDWELYWDDSEDELFWAPVHAWRILGQLKARAAAEPLVSVLGFNDEYDSDWIGEEVPLVFGMIGPSAIPFLKKLLKEGGDKLWGRVSAGYSLERIGNKNYQARFDCIAVLAEQLKEYDENDETLNAFLISYLLDLKAVEALPVIEEAYQANCVDLTVCGDWEDVQIEFGILNQRISPKPYGLFGHSDPFLSLSGTRQSNQDRENKENRTPTNQEKQKDEKSPNKKRKRRRKKK